MKKELKNKINRIKKTKQKRINQSICLIELSEEAYHYGDITSYDLIWNEIIKLNKNLVKIQKNERFQMNPQRISHKPMPDIDYDR
jgi:hypothetical protein